MRALPQLTPAQQSILTTNAFRGYDHREIIADGCMFDMQNLSGDKSPLLTVRRKRGTASFDVEGQDPVPLTGISGRDQLVMIRGTQVYYNHIPVQGVTVSADTNMLPKKIVHMGAYCCIWPDKVFFNTISLSECGSMERLYSLAGNNLSVQMCRGDGTDYSSGDITTSSTEPADPENGMLWLDTSGDNDVLRQWADATGEWIEIATTYVKISAIGIGQGLKEYDTVQLSGLTAPDAASDKIKAQVNALNMNAIIYFCGDNYIVVAGLLSEGLQALKNVTVRADRKVPDLDFVVESNNRLWGCKYGIENGKAVNELRACKLGDFKNWSCFMGLSTDSYTASVGTDGYFTGAVNLKGYPVFFKEHCIHRVGGTGPSSFSITTTMCRGVQAGSWRSVAVVGDACYYKSSGGVMMYDGSMPLAVSDALGGVRYSDARAGGIDDKYYISMKDQTNVWTLFLLDTKTGLWWKEDALQALGFARVGDEMFAIDEAHNTLVALFGSYGTAEAEIAWNAVFGIEGTNGQTNQTYTAFRNKKYLSRFVIRMYIEPETDCYFWIQYDGGEWEQMGQIRGNSMRSFTLPVVPRRCDHLRFKIAGTGDMRIYQISRVLEVGSDA